MSKVRFTEARDIEAVQMSRPAFLKAAELYQHSTGDPRQTGAMTCEQSIAEHVLPRAGRPQVNPIDILGAEEVCASAPASSRFQGLAL